MKSALFCLMAIMFVSVMFAQENPLSKSSNGDWAKYLVTTKNETVPLMSSKDQPRWWTVSNVGEGFVRIDAYIMFGDRRAPAGGRLSYFKDPFEPIPGLGKSAKIQIVSTTKEKLTIKGKEHACVKIVRKIDQPLDEANVQSSWVGSSTIWICDQIPLGLAKMENAFETRLSKSDKGTKQTETWIVDEFGFKNYK